MSNKTSKKITFLILLAVVFTFYSTISVLAEKGKTGGTSQQTEQKQSQNQKQDNKSGKNQESENGKSNSGSLDNDSNQSQSVSGDQSNQDNSRPDVSNKDSGQQDKSQSSSQQVASTEEMQRIIDSIAVQVQEISRQAENLANENNSLSSETNPVNPAINSLTSTNSGYALGKLDMEIDQNFWLAKLGETKEKPGEIELKNKVYVAEGILPFKMNDEDLLAKNIKISSSLRIRGAENEIRGGIDIDLVTGEHIDMQFEGNILEKSSSTLSADIDITIVTATGRFIGLATFEGSHVLKIEESGSAIGAPVHVSIVDVSGKSAIQPSASQPNSQLNSQPNVPTETIQGQVSASGPGYPTGPLNILLPATELLLNKAGQVKEQPGSLEIKGRLYENTGSFPVTVNGEILTANEIKLSIDLRTKNGVSEQQGFVDIDIDDGTLGSHLTIEYRGTAIISEDQIVSGGVFKTTKTTGKFAGLVAEGNYSLIVDPSGNTQVLKADITLSTASAL